MPDDILTQFGQIVTRNGKIVLVPPDLSLEDIEKCCCICCKEVFLEEIFGFINIYGGTPSRSSPNRFDPDGYCWCAGINLQFTWQYDEENCIFFNKVESAIGSCIPEFIIQLSCAIDPNDACHEGKPPNRNFGGNCENYLRARVVRNGVEGEWISPVESCHCCRCDCADFDLSSEFSQEELGLCCSTGLPFPEFQIYFTIHHGRDVFGFEDRHGICSRFCGCSTCLNIQETIEYEQYYLVNDGKINSDGPFYYYDDIKNTSCLKNYCWRHQGFNKSIINNPPSNDPCNARFNFDLINDGFCDIVANQFEFENWRLDQPIVPFDTVQCIFLPIESPSQSCNEDGGFIWRSGKICFQYKLDAGWVPPNACDGCPDCFEIVLEGKQGALFSADIKYSDPILEQEEEDFSMEVLDWKSMIGKEDETT